MEVELEAVLARVPGARDQRLRPEQRASQEPVVPKLERRVRHVPPEHLGRARPLQGEQRRLVRAILEPHARRAVLAHPGQVLLTIRRVHDDHELRLGTVDEQVVHDPAVRVAHGRVHGLAGLGGRQVVRDQPVHECERLGSRDEELAHVRDVEQPRALPHELVLPHVAGVADRHLVAREVDEPGSGRDVEGMERRTLDGVRRAHGWLLEALEHATLDKRYGRVKRAARARRAARQFPHRTPAAHVR